MDNTIFLQGLHFVLKSEGGYVNNPADSGGATNKGVTQAVYDGYRKTKHLNIQSVKNISDSEVKDIYYVNYWLEAGCNKLAAKMAIVVFDTAVNMGVGRSKEFLHTCNGSVDKFLALRLQKYKDLVVKYPKNQKFIRGWTNRVNDLKVFLNTIH